jgi:predicted acyltransferase
MPKALPQRIASFDQFRGYTILGMLFVNYIGRFGNASEFFKHHGDYITFADTIAINFLFMVGMGFRLSLTRNIERLGARRAYWEATRRYLTLLAIGIFIYSPMDWHGWWDALVDIGLSGLLALPFIARGPRVRTVAAFGYLAFYQLLFSRFGYGEYTMNHSFDGGPLGPLSWVFPLLMGTIAYDCIASGDTRRIVRDMLLWGASLCALGWLLHISWPGVKAVWNFSQCAMSSPYPLFDTGLAFLVFLPFHFLCDRTPLRVPMLTVLGFNPLVIYIVHGMYFDLHKEFGADNLPAMKAYFSFILPCLVIYAVARYLYNNKIVIKL